MRTSVTTEERNALRRLAVGLLGNGVTLAETAEALEVSVSSVKRWKKAFRQGSETALIVQRPPGAKSRLLLEQRDRLRQLVIAGPLAAGFATDLWTCARVAIVIEREFGVSYHPDHVGRILHDLASRRKSRSAAPASEMKPRSNVGGATPGPASKKGTATASYHRFSRRNRLRAAAFEPPHLGLARFATAQV